MTSGNGAAAVSSQHDGPECVAVPKLWVITKVVVEPFPVMVPEALEPTGPAAPAAPAGPAGPAGPPPPEICTQVLLVALHAQNVGEAGETFICVGLVAPQGPVGLLKTNTRLFGGPGWAYAGAHAITHAMPHSRNSPITSPMRKAPPFWRGSQHPHCPLTCRHLV